MGKHKENECYLDHIEALKFYEEQTGKKMTATELCKLIGMGDKPYKRQQLYSRWSKKLPNVVFYIEEIERVTGCPRNKFIKQINNE